LNLRRIRHVGSHEVRAIAELASELGAELAHIGDHDARAAARELRDARRPEAGATAAHQKRSPI
jgi:hypothetical protein